MAAFGETVFGKQKTLAERVAENDAKRKASKPSKGRKSMHERKADPGSYERGVTIARNTTVRKDPEPKKAEAPKKASGPSRERKADPGSYERGTAVARNRAGASPPTPARATASNQSRKERQKVLLAADTVKPDPEAGRQGAMKRTLSIAGTAKPSTAAFMAARKPAPATKGGGTTIVAAKPAAAGGISTAAASVSPGQGSQRQSGNPPAANAPKVVAAKASSPAPTKVKAKAAPAKKKVSAGEASNRDLGGRSSVTYRSKDGTTTTRTSTDGKGDLSSPAKPPSKPAPVYTAPKQSNGPGGGADAVLAATRGLSRIERMKAARAR
jgi:hypothetical protein